MPATAERESAERDCNADLTTTEVRGAPILPGFTLALGRIWNPGL
jgi:hypothetical protein